MPHRFLRRSWAPLCALSLVSSSCTSPEKGNPPPVDECASRTGRVQLPAAVCTAGARWTTGTKAFVEATDKWGLRQLGVDGVRLNVADLDGDGWADLVVRKVGVGSDDFAAGKRRTWLLRNTHQGSFEDVTESSGFLRGRTLDPTKGRPGEVMAFADVDNDGDLDGYTGVPTNDSKATGGETSEILLNDGKGHFSLGSAENGVRRVGEIDVPAGASFVDVDLDGKLDLWVPQHSWDDGGMLSLQSGSLFLGDGAGGFTKATEELGLVSEDWYRRSPSGQIRGYNLRPLNEARAHARAWSGAACDLNGDGLPELLAASYGRAPNHLWQARRGEDGALFYENRSLASGYAFDDDKRWNDNVSGACYCAQNPSHAGCEGAPQPVINCNGSSWDPGFDEQPFRLGGNSGATACADLDNDGDLDLVTSEIKHWWAGSGSDGAEVLVNGGEDEVRFTRPGRQRMGLEVPHGGVDWDEGIMTNAVLDFDNDGWPDLYLGGSDYPGNRGMLFHQKEKLRFESVPIDVGIDMHRSHGVAVADFDRDGDLDVVVGHSTSRCDLQDSDAPCYRTPGVRLFENTLGQTGNWLQLRLEGCSRTNRGAVGARVTVAAGGVTQTQEVDGGHGHYGAQNDQVLHFGLGAACEATVSVRWPNGQLTTDTFQLAAGHRYRLKEGGDPAVEGR